MSMEEQPSPDARLLPPTPLCVLLGIDLPIIQAPIGRVSTSALAAAVSEAGALGMLGVSYLEPDAIRALIRQTRARTDRPFGINVLLRWPQEDRLAAALDEGCRIVSLFWADREPLKPAVSQAHAAGAIVMHTVGSAEEARRARDMGVDVIVAQGTDAGGHVWGRVGTLALVPAVVDAVAPTPVVAAGGIGDGRGLAAVLALGADAAWMGTAFVIADEAASTSDYRDRVIEATETDAVITEGVFNLGFDNAPVRTLPNSTIERWVAAGAPRTGQRPGEGDIIARRGDGSPILRYDFIPPTIDLDGDLEPLPHYAGQSAGVIRRRRPAADIVRTTAAEAAATLERLGRVPSPPA